MSNQERVRNVIDGAIADLTDLGMQREAALSLLAFQACIRLESQQRLARLAVDVIDLVHDRARLGEIAATVLNRGQPIPETHKGSGHAQT
jgi:hypothetical protein